MFAQIVVQDFSKALSDKGMLTLKKMMRTGMEIQPDQQGLSEFLL